MTDIQVKLGKKIEELKKSNEKAMAAFVPCWTEIEHDRGMIDGLEYAIKVIDANIRDCENCKHHTENGCDSWDCEFEPIEAKSDSDWGCRNCKYFTKFYVPPVDSYKGQSDGFCCTCFKEFAMWLGSNKEQAGNGMCEKFSEVKPNEHM